MRTFVRAVAVALVLASRAQALPSFRAMVDRHAGYKTSCRVCHQPGDNRLTSYAREYMRLDGGVSALKALDVMDPDQDGSPSKDEFALSSNPGDQRSTPRHVGDWLAKIEPVAAPLGPLTAVFGATVEIAVREPLLTREQVDQAEAFLGERLRDEERQPTLFLVRQKKDGGELVGYATYAFFGKERLTTALVVLLPGSEDHGPILRDVRPLKIHGDQRLGKEDYLKQFDGKTYETLIGVAPPLGAEEQNARLLAAVRRAMKIAEVAVEGKKRP